MRCKCREAGICGGTRKLTNVDASAALSQWIARLRCFILYTSGSTGKPKGILHTTGGYLLYVKMTMRYVFDLRDDDISGALRI